MTVESVFPSAYSDTEEFEDERISASPMSAERSALVTANVPLVQYLVREIAVRIPTHINRDELASAGMLALVLTALNFDLNRGVPFARFAAIRIRGALKDELRGMDWAARPVRSRAREAHSVTAQLSATLGRTPTTEETAKALGVSAAKLESLRKDIDRASVVSLQGFAPETAAALVSDTAPGPEALLVGREKLGYLHDAIAELPERFRKVVIDYFFRQRQMSDIAADLGVTESRVSQMRAEALKLIKDGMNSQLDPSMVTPAKSSQHTALRATYHASIASRRSLAERLAHTTVNGVIKVSI